ncbi:MAG: cytochrome P450 [Proteobacteria bacterium]|nr:cytochrome P450 [Pseudomonadota bacterium]
MHRDLDLLDGALYAGDPDPTYAWMRAHAPAYWDAANELWGITRYADVIEIEKDPETFCSSLGYRPGLHGRDATMIGQDDPQHLAQRKILYRRFTPHKVKTYESSIRATARELIGRVASRGSCDLVAELAIPLPVITIIELIGFGREQWPEMADWAETTNAAGGGPRYLNPGVVEAFAQFKQRAQALIEQRRKAPADDAVSAMLEESRGGSGRSDDDIHMEALLLLNGGSDTTRHVIGGGSLALLQHPEQMAWLREHPEALPTAVEELIRWVTPILNMRRTATRDTEVAGQSIAEGEQVLLMYSSANRDENVFEDPDRLDVKRRPNPHIAFGFGTHFCLGASLARLELRVVFEELLRSLPDLRLAPGFEPDYVPNAFTRGLRELQVEFTPRPAGEAA